MLSEQKFSEDGSQMEGTTIPKATSPDGSVSSKDSKAGPKEINSRDSPLSPSGSTAKNAFSHSGPKSAFSPTVAKFTSFGPKSSLTGSGLDTPPIIESALEGVDDQAKVPLIVAATKAQLISSRSKSSAEDSSSVISVVEASNVAAYRQSSKESGVTTPVETTKIEMLVRNRN